MPGCLKHEPIGAGTAGPWPSASEPGSFLTADGLATSTAGLIAKAAGARYILLGESHTSPCDHLVQAAALAALAEAGLRPAVGLEMVPADKQPALDDFNAGKLGVAELEKAVDWPHVWGYDYAMYAPIFAAAKAHGLPLYALNAPAALIREAAEKGLDNLAPQQRALLPARVIAPPADQEQSLREEFQAHQAMGHRAKTGQTGQIDQAAAAPEQNPGERPAMAKASFERFLFVQSLWDTQMAQRALAAFTAAGRPVVVLAGGGHVEFGYGVASRLAVLDPGAKIVSVLAWRGGAPPEPGQADVYFYCPETHKSRLGFQVEIRDGKAAAIQVEPGSKAERAGMLAGDVIAAAAGKPVTTLADLHQAAVAALAAGQPLTLTIARPGGEVGLTIELGGK
ncbi:MAG: ChaN family lipoprotein [Desulfovibrionaceae bacterium]|nr:ChaN family lipoprotein [Desulfovibrionaceae bacterium]MBF0514598.1 ChaN family lipoprotein [Desulfovibrionaceae bacterium]